MKIVLLDTSPEIMEMLKELLEQEGDEVVHCDIYDLKRGETDIVKFIEDEEPDTILYDIPPPYLENWNFFKLLKKAFPDIHYVITTTSKKSLDSHVKEHNLSNARLLDNAIQIISKPFSIEHLVDIIHHA